MLTSSLGWGQDWLLELKDSGWLGLPGRVYMPPVPKLGNPKKGKQKAGLKGAHDHHSHCVVSELAQ